MKILWLSPYPIEQLINTSKKSHSASWIVNLASELSKRTDIDLHILTTNSAINKKYIIIKNNNIVFHIIKFNLPFTNLGFPKYLPYDSFTWYWKLIKRGKKIINQVKPDLIHAHGIEKGFSLLACKSGIENITSIQGSMIKISRYSHSLKILFQIPIEIFCLKNNTNFGCRTCWDYNLVTSFNRKSKIYYMPELINQVFFDKIWNNENFNSLVFVGSVIKRKGIEILIHSIKIVKKKIPDIKVNIIGGYSNKYLHYLEKKINKLGIQDNIVFWGIKENLEIAEILSKSTAFVLPTLIDNSPNSLAEAMAVGIPCIASDAGGIKSMIDDNENGVLFPSRNIEILAKKIVRVCTERNFREKIAKNAKQTAYIRNYKDNVIRQTIKVYQEILNRRK